MEKIIVLLVLVCVLQKEILFCHSWILPNLPSSKSWILPNLPSSKSWILPNLLSSKSWILPNLPSSSCSGVGPPEVLGTVFDPDISEASGLAVSSPNKKLLWTINDSGGSAIVFGVDENGDTLVKVNLEGAVNYDWEAVTTAPCEAGANQRCVYVADTGDNLRKRENITMYKFVEPIIDNLENLGGAVLDISIDNWTSLLMKYPDGQSHDCESIIIDPSTRNLLLLTKSLLECRVYLSPLDNDGQVVLEDAHLSLSSLFATDASSSEDGNAVIIRGYISAWIWRKTDSSISVLEMLREMQPCFILTDLQRQGESVGMKPDGEAFYLHSEGVGQDIIKHTLK